MKFTLPAVTLAAVTFAAAAGCQQQQSQPKPATDSAALELTPSTPAPMAAPVSYSPPMQSAMPDPALAPISAAPSGVVSASSSGTYTVRKGDTLWKIAASRYGNGKKWKEIADANPGLTPSALRVGQQIELP
jgi:5'-nucleotidase